MAADSTARLLQASTTSALEAGDALTLALQGAVSDWDLRDDAQGQRIWQRLTGQMAATPHVSSFWVLDAGGTILFENWAYRPTREFDPRTRHHYRAHLDGEQGLVIEPAALGTVTGKRRFTLSRAVRDADGGLRAIAVVALYSETFAGIFEQALHGFPGGFCLVNLDGAVLARYPDDDAAHFAGTVSQFLKQMGDQDSLQVREHGASWSMRRLSGLPLVVVTHLSVTESLTPWYRRTLLTGILVGAASIGLTALVLFGLRIARSESEAWRQLEAVNQDLDQRVRVRTAELERALRSAETANQAKGKFLAAISHDLRQPLQGVALFTELAGQVIEDQRLRRLGDMTLSSLQAGRRLLDDLVDLGRLESGAARLDIGVVPLGPLLARLVADSLPLAERKGLCLRQVATSRAVVSDPVRLQQIVQNLLSNAIKYTRAGAVLVGCRRAADEIRIEVWDTGPGISAEHLDLIFEEFYQIDNQARNSSQGVGLGLAIVDRTARLLGHRVEVCSVVGRGTVFSVSLPAA